MKPHQPIMADRPPQRPEGVNQGPDRAGAGTPLTRHRLQYLPDQRLQLALHIDGKAVVGIPILNVDVKIDAVVVVGVILTYDGSRCQAVAQTRVRAEESPIRESSLEEIRLRERILRKRQQTIEVLTVHADVRIIIPGDEAPMPHRAQQRPRKDGRPDAMRPANFEKNAHQVEMDGPDLLQLDRDLIPTPGLRFQKPLRQVDADRQPVLHSFSSRRLFFNSVLDTSGVRGR